MSFPCRLIFISTVAFSLVAQKSNAQVLYGSIVGAVTDSASAAVPGATVRITHLETNQSRQITTNDSGNYIFPDAPAGTYEVVITKNGFQSFTARDLKVDANSVVRLNAALQIGAISQSVVVSAEAAALQTDRADVHSELTRQTIENVPVAGRSYQSLFFLTPGVTQPDYFQTGGIITRPAP